MRERSPAAPSGGSMPSNKILVIDDEPQIRRVVRHALEGDAQGVLEAETGQEGIDLAAWERPTMGRATTELIMFNNWRTAPDGWTWHAPDRR